MAVKVAARKAVRKATKPMAPKRQARKAKKAKKITKKSLTGTMRQVWAGRKTYTVGGLQKSSLMMNKRGKVVSKARHTSGKKLAKHGITKWCAATKKARKELNITGFVKINRGAQGVALYKLAKKYYGN